MVSLNDECILKELLTFKKDNTNIEGRSQTDTFINPELTNPSNKIQLIKEKVKRKSFDGQ